MALTPSSSAQLLLQKKRSCYGRPGCCLPFPLQIGQEQDSEEGKSKTQKMCRGMKNVPQPTTAMPIPDSHSLDEFVTFMYDAFGLRDGRQHRLQELKSIDALTIMVKRMVKGLATHLVGEDSINTNQHDLDKLQVMFDFMNLMVLHFNRTELFHEQPKSQLYAMFLRDVQLPFMRQGIAMITNQDAPLFHSPADRDTFRSGSLMTHLLYMLDPAYLRDAETHVDAWFSTQKALLGHGVGTDFKKALRGYKGKSSNISIKTINKRCVELDEDNTAVIAAKFPSTKELRAFWYSARVAIYLSKRLDFAEGPHDAFTELKDHCLVLLENSLASDVPLLHADDLNAPFEKLSIALTKSSQLTRHELSVIADTVSANSKYNVVASQDIIQQPIIKFCYDFNAVISLIADGDLPQAYERTIATLNDSRQVSVGRLQGILTQIGLALGILLNNTVIKNREYEHHAKVAFLFGSYGFSLEKHNHDPFQTVTDSMFSTPSVLYALSSIQTHAEVLESIEVLSLKRKISMMVPFPKKLEKALKALYSKHPHLDAASTKAIHEVLQPFMKGNCIPYIPKSTLYRCLCEIHSLIEFWPSWVMDTSAYVRRFSQEPVELKRKVLRSIDHYRYNEDVRNNEVSSIIFNVQLTHEGQPSIKGTITLPLENGQDNDYSKEDLVREVHKLMNKQNTPQSD